jgi:hypothetical protein
LGETLAEDALPTSDIWSEDKSDRRLEAEMLLRFLLGQLEIKRRLGREEAYVINVDAPWGSGKTFFLERFARDLRSRGFAVVFFNAWEADHIDDPLIALFAEVKAEFERLSAGKKSSGQVSGKLSSLKRRAGAVATRVFAAGLKQAGRSALGDDGLQAVIEAATVEAVDAGTESLVEKFERRKQAAADFRRELADLAATLPDDCISQRPVFIFVDELDRCRPSYAISLFERVKHILAVDGFVFVFGTDTAQLSHSIAGEYGAGFDGQGYMKRLFGRTYRLREPRMSDFVAQRFDDLGLDERLFGKITKQTPKEFISSLLSYSECTLRDAEQIIEKLQTFVSVWPYAGVTIWLQYLLPLLIEETLSGAQIRDGRLSAWTYQIASMEQVRENYHRVQTQRSLNDYRDQLFRYGTNLFVDATDTNRDSMGWLLEAFIEERGKLHNNSYRRDSPPASLLLGYPNLLRLTAPFVSGKPIQ